MYILIWESGGTCDVALTAKGRWRGKGQTMMDALAAQKSLAASVFLLLLPLLAFHLAIDVGELAIIPAQSDVEEKGEGKKCEHRPIEVVCALRREHSERVLEGRAVLLVLLLQREVDRLVAWAEV